MTTTKRFFRQKILFLFLLFPFASYSQVGGDYNLGLEQLPGTDSIVHWEKGGDFTLTRTDEPTGSGKPVVLLQDFDEASIRISWISNTIKKSFKGDSISFQGYIKTENIVYVYPYFLAGSENELGAKITGTRDWAAFKIDLEFSEMVRTIMIGFSAAGKGKVWLRDLSLKIDGVDIEQLTPLEPIKSSSGFHLQDVSKTTVSRLALLGKVWGFMKYYHPAVAAGDFNWDKELFKALPLIQQEDFDQSLLDWVKQFDKGSLKPGGAYPKDSLSLKRDLSWLTDKKHLSRELRDELRKIRDAKRTGGNYYATLDEYDVFKYRHEDTYPDMSYEDDGIKLLALFRFWNAIQYFYPYRDLISQDWDTVPIEFIPKIICAKDELHYKLTLAELIGKIEDSHAVVAEDDEVLQEYFGLKQAVALQTEILDDQLVVTYVFEDGLPVKPGDMITHIDGVSVRDKIQALYPYSIGSNRAATHRNIVQRILRTNNDSLVLRLQRGQEEIKTSLITQSFWDRADWHPPVERPAIEIKKDYAYFNDKNLTKEDYKKAWPEVKDKKGIIIDRRNYPEDDGYYFFLPFLFKGSVIFYQLSSSSIEFPGNFYYTYQAGGNTGKEAEYNGKMIILVNHQAQSAAETRAFILRQYPKAIVVGSQTAGADGMMTSFVLPGNLTTYFTSKGFYDMDGITIQKTGVPIDYKVYPTIEDLRNHRDAVYDKAVELILK